MAVLCTLSRLRERGRGEGKEAAAVVLVDVDPCAERLEQDLRMLFCGMTRATVRLDLIVRRGNPENRRFVEAASRK